MKTNLKSSVGVKGFNSLGLPGLTALKQKLNLQIRHLDREILLNTRTKKRNVGEKNAVMGKAMRRKNYLLTARPCSCT